MNIDYSQYECVPLITGEVKSGNKVYKYVYWDN